MAKERTPNKQEASEISDTSKFKVSFLGTKDGVRKTVVDLLYHKHPGYATLPKYQREELCEWPLKNPNRKGHTKGRENKRLTRNKSIAAAVEK